ncbi:FAS1 domain-containing protein SELMODRAFT_448915 [Mercurialis annua]|uniref:FAS1 domain-containing protein SELMODRAFT_448915 n=1 Tax=Mercurialis annua TaxID=3986 RepID=UPI002160EB02|nr:FAS1 domain-containing protein SELMODRAFT_448915 [Mercurialis annua]
MANDHYITVLLPFLLLLTAPLITTATDKSHALDVAIDEMTTANYFTFVTLINMSPLDDRIQGNVTFLMPNDRILSKSTIPENSLFDFLLRHSIPSPLLFEHLQRIPSGSSIPSSDSGFMLDINNNGRKSYYINNVRIISPNICTAGSSIRCHGIDGVLLAAADKNVLPSCPNATSPAVVVLSPAASPANDGDQIIMGGAPQTVQDGDGPRKSSASHEMSMKLFVNFSVSMLVILGFNYIRL